MSKKQIGLIPSIITIIAILMIMTGTVLLIISFFISDKDKNLYNKLGQGLLYSGFGISTLIVFIYAPWKDIIKDIKATYKK